MKYWLTADVFGIFSHRFAASSHSCAAFALAEFLRMTELISLAPVSSSGSDAWLSAVVSVGVAFFFGRDAGFFVTVRGILHITDPTENGCVQRCVEKHAVAFHITTNINSAMRNKLTINDMHNPGGKMRLVKISRFNANDA